MGHSPFKSKPDKSNEPGLFIGVHIDFAEFRIAILSEEWKGVEEKKAITSDHPIEIPKVSKESENQKLLADTIVKQIAKNLKNNKDFHKRYIKKIVISYNESDAHYEGLRKSFKNAVKNSEIKSLIDEDQVERMPVRFVYSQLIFSHGSPNQRLTEYNEDHPDWMDPKAEMFNGVLFCGSTIWSLLTKIQSTADGEASKVGLAGKYSHGETNEKGSGYAIARNILNEAISDNFSDDVGGESLLEKIRVHFGLANPRDIVRLMNQNGFRQKLASFARSFNPINETDPLDMKIRDEFDKAGETITYGEYLTDFDNAKKKKMAIFLIGFRPKHFEYFHFKKPGSGQLNIKWYGLDEELDNPEVAAAYFASSLVLGEPLNSLNVKHYANSYDVQNGIVLDNKMLP